MIRNYLVKYKIYLTFTCILLFYFITSFVYLNRIFIERNVSILNADYNYATLAQPEAHYYRNVKKYFKEFQYNLEDVAVVPFFFTTPNSVLVVKISITPKNKLELFQDTKLAVSQSEKLLDMAVMATKIKSTHFDIVGTSSYSYFFENTRLGLIKLFIYSLLFTMISTAIIYFSHLLKKILKMRSPRLT